MEDLPCHGSASDATLWQLPGVCGFASSRVPLHLSCVVILTGLSALFGSDVHLPLTFSEDKKQMAGMFSDDLREGEKLPHFFSCLTFPVRPVSLEQPCFWDTWQRATWPLRYQSTHRCIHGLSGFLHRFLPNLISLFTNTFLLWNLCERDCKDGPCPLYVIQHSATFSDVTWISWMTTCYKIFQFNTLTWREWKLLF